MSELIVVVYPTITRAEEARRRLLELQRDYLVTLDDAVIASRTDKGGIKLDQLINTTAVGAATGSFWGLLIGLLFLNPLLGVAAGASSGALGGILTDVGLSDAFMKGLATSLQPGNGALFVLIKTKAPARVLKEITRFGGDVLKTSLDETREQALRDALRQAMTAETAQATSPTPSTGRKKKSAGA